MDASNCMSMFLLVHVGIPLLLASLAGEHAKLIGRVTQENGHRSKSGNVPMVMFDNEGPNATTRAAGNDADENKT